MKEVIEGKDYNKVQVVLYQIKQIIITYLEGYKLSLESLDKIKNSNIFDIPESAHGDYTTNVAMMCAKELSVSPRELAEKLIDVLRLAPSLGESNERSALVRQGPEFEVAGAGFINIRLGDELARSAFDNIGQVKNLFTGKNVLVEHSSPNLFKPFSIGHLMNNIIGETTQRLATTFGANIETMSFPSDISLGIAKAMMIIEREVNNGTTDPNFLECFERFKNDDKSPMSIEHGVACSKYLGDTYVRSVKECDENENSLNEAKNILDRLYKLEDEKLKELFYFSRIVNTVYFTFILKVIGTLNDRDSKEHEFVFESEAGNKGVVIIKESFGEDKVFKYGEESEGGNSPVIYIPDESRKDIHTSVFINSQGYPTYEAKDLGLIYIKMTGGLNLDDYGREVKIQKPDYSFTITDAEQIPHFEVVFDAALAIAKYNEENGRDVSEFGDWREWVSASHHVPHGRMLFKGKKMSSRLGGVPLALDVIEIVKEEAREKLGDKVVNHTEAEKEKIVHEVAMSALRIAVLRAKPGININFDPETSLSFEGDSGPYLLYTHARCASLIDKGWEKFNLNIDKDIFIKGLDFDKNKNINELESHLLHYNDVLLSCVKFDNNQIHIEPQKLVSYLFRVAREFNSFYGNTQIISDDEKLTKHNLKIVLWAKTVLSHGLHILGIEAQERM